MFRGDGHSGKRDRDRETQLNKQTNRQTDRQTNRQTKAWETGRDRHFLVQFGKEERHTLSCTFCSLTSKSSQGLPELVEVRMAADCCVWVKQGGLLETSSVRGQPYYVALKLEVYCHIRNALESLPFCLRQIDWMSLGDGSAGPSSSPDQGQSLECQHLWVLSPCTLNFT